VFKLRTEQWLLFAVLLLCGLGAAAKAWLLPDLAGNGQSGGGRNVTRLPEGVVAGLMAQWNHRPHLEQPEHRIFIARDIVYYPSTDKIEAITPESKDPDGITVAWKRKYGFALDDPTVASQDTDHDGFTNKEEFLAGTDPRDANSRPPVVLKLRVTAYNYVAFKMEFKGANPQPDGSYKYQVNLISPNRRTLIVVKDQEVEGYRVGNYTESIVERYNDRSKMTEKVDESTLDMINIKLNEVVKLVLNKKTESDESQIAFATQIQGKEPEPAQIKRGNSFTLDAVSYQVLKAAQDSAVIKDVGSGKMFKIPAAGSNETVQAVETN